MRGQIIPEEEDYMPDLQALARESSVFNLGPDWKEKADAEREHFYRRQPRAHPDPSPQYDSHVGATQYEQPGDAENNYCDDYAHDDNDDHEYQGVPPLDWVDEADAGGRGLMQTNCIPTQNNHTSHAGTFNGIRVKRSLAQAHAENKDTFEPAVRSVRSKNIEDQVGQNTGENVMAPPPKPACATKDFEKSKRVIRNIDFDIPERPDSPLASFTKTKDTSFGTSSPSPTSEHEMELPSESGAAAHKRSFEESLDYTREQLVEMSYDDLDKKPFLADPTEPPREPARNQNGIELTLEERLAKMTDMTEEQCKAMFTSMTDAENEGTGQWFIAKMQEDMEKLMTAKHERRMIALKYEHEIKRRNSIVKAKTEDVEGELQDLRSGLGNLMPASKKDQRETAKAEKKAAKKARS
jgi:hypothetical protein